jgi:predicted AAA+ superfamily ATPase
MYPAAIVTGPRQAGKTTLLKEVIKGVKYVTLDNHNARIMASETPSLFFMQYEPPLIVDEIQYEPGILHNVKIIADETKKKGQFYLTGSQAFHLMKDVTESLAGRAGVLELLGLSYREIRGVAIDTEFYPTTAHMDAIKISVPEFDYHEIISVMQKGFFPAVYENGYDQEAREIFFNDYISTYIERDVSALSQVADKSAFVKFITATASLTGQHLNLTTLAQMAGKEVNTIKRWLSILEISGLIFILEPYYDNMAKRLTKTPKLYFLDTGLACCLCGWNSPEQLIKGAMSGHMFETFVMSEILKSYKNAGKNTRMRFSYYRDREGREIDLIIEKEGTLHPVEIKLTGDPKRSDITAFKGLERLQKPVGEGGIICMCDSPLFLTEKYKAIPANMI